MLFHSCSDILTTQVLDYSACKVEKMSWKFPFLILSCLPKRKQQPGGYFPGWTKKGRVEYSKISWKTGANRKDGFLGDLAHCQVFLYLPRYSVYIVSTPQTSLWFRNLGCLQQRLRSKSSKTPTTSYCRKWARPSGFFQTIRHTLH